MVSLTFKKMHISKYFFLNKTTMSSFFLNNWFEFTSQIFVNNLTLIQMDTDYYSVNRKFLLRKRCAYSVNEV